MRDEETPSPIALPVVVASDAHALARNPCVAYLTRLQSDGSRKVQLAALKQIARVALGVVVAHAEIDPFAMEWHTLRYVHTNEIAARVAKRYAPATANRLYAALRGVLKECWRLELVSAEDYHRAIDFANVRGKGLPAGRDLERGEVAALLRTCAGGRVIDVRDEAIIAVLYLCGIRRAELVALDAGDYNAKAGKITVRHGKGNKARTVYIGDSGLASMARWLTARGAHAGALFPPVDRHGNMRDKRLTAHGVYAILRARATKAGIEMFTPHDLRRTFIGSQLDAGTDIVTVSKMAGHANTSTTGGYDRRPETTKREAANRVRLPKDELI